MKSIHVLVAGMVGLVLPLTALADNWPQWRGPALNGTATETGLPDKLDPKETAVWTLSLPGYGASTPVIWGDRLFLTSTDKQSMKLLALCVDIKSGKEVWRREVAQGIAPNARGNNNTTPSPITDGKTVWFLFGAGELAAFDMEGKPLWERNLVTEYGPFHVKWIYGSSPLLQWGKLYVQVLVRDVPANGPAIPGAPAAESYLLALDPMTGKNIFRQIRSSPAIAETKESYATPIPHEAGGRKEIVLVGADCVTGHDSETGAELWRLRGWNPQNRNNFRVVATPVVLDENILVCTPHPTGVIIAVKPGGSGDITDTHKAWTVSHTRTDVPSPFVYDKDLFVWDGDFKKGLSRLDPKTGDVKFFTPITSAPVFRASPLAADGKVYAMNEEGQVWVVSATDGKVLSNTTLATEGTARGSIVASQGKIFVRTGSTLYCFGSK